MNYRDLSNFTYGELENFTYEELELGIPDLLAKVKKDNRPIPVSVYEKLNELCETLKSEPQIDKKVLSDISNGISKKTTKMQIIKIITEIIKLVVVTAELYEKVKPIIKHIIALFDQA